METHNLFESLGFRQNPFTRFSAEEEVAYLNNIYYKPKYFQSLYNDIRGGSSRFIFGERGSGKSALIIELHKALNRDKVFSVIIDDYDDVPVENNEFHFVLLMLKKVLKEYVFAISKNPQLVKKLSKIEKEKLSLFIKEFFNTVSPKEFVGAVDKVNRIKSKNIIKRIYNDYVNKPLNATISTAMEISSDWIRRSVNLPSSSNETIYRAYLPELTYDEIQRTGMEKQLVKEKNYRLVKDLILDLMAIIKASGYENTVVFFDKIDEFKKVSGRIRKIVDFTVNILRDTELLYRDDFGLVFSLWSEVKTYLNEKGVRFDKFKPVDISWTHEEMIGILKKRVSYFAESKSDAQLDNILPSNVDLTTLITLCNRSPRDMIRLFSAIYDEQEITNQSARIFNVQVIQKATIKFCKEYDYYSIYPSEKGSKEDIIGQIERLLKLSLTTFNFNQFASTFSMQRDQAIFYLSLLTESCLIKNDLTEDENLYKIQDPKIIHLITNGYRSLN